MAYAIVSNPDDAQDVAQEAFLRAYRAIGRLDHNRSFADWIRRITVNCAISSLRKRKRIAKNAAPGAELENVMATDDSTQGATADELQMHVREALTMLPPQQRAAMTLFALKEMDMADVADAMGCARPTVRVHLHRARHKLRGLLAEYLAESAGALKGDDAHEV